MAFEPKVERSVGVCQWVVVKVSSVFQGVVPHGAVCVPGLLVPLSSAMWSDGDGSGQCGWGPSIESLEKHTKNLDLIPKSNKKLLMALNQKST